MIQLITKRLESIPKHFKSSFVIFFSSFITSASGFLVTPIFTRLLSLDEYGLIAQYNSWLNIVAVFATLSLSFGVYQVAMNEFKDDRDSYTLSSLILSNLATIVVFAPIFFFSNWFSDYFHLPNSLLVLMFIYLLFNPAMSMWIARQRYELEYKRVAIISISSTLISQIVSVLAVMHINDYNLGIVRLYSMQLPMVIYSFVLYFMIAKGAKFKVQWSYIKYALLFNLPLISHYLAQYALRSTDKIMITNFIGEAATGIYSLATTVANISMLAWSAMAASLTPYIYENLNTKSYDKINKAVVFVSLVFGTCCVGASLIGPEIVYILGSQKYMPGVQLIPPIAASSFLAAIYSYYSFVAFYHHKTSSIALMTIIAALVNFVLNYIFIPLYGSIAAAYATEGAYLLYTFLHFLNYKRIVEKERVYNDTLIMCITGIVTVLSILAGFFYNGVIIRYSILSLMFFVIIYNKKRLLSSLHFD